MRAAQTSRRRTRARKRSPLAEVREALASAPCEVCAEKCFVRGPRGELIGGVPSLARRWIHDAVDALLEASRVRSAITRPSATTRAIDRELAAAVAVIEGVVLDLDDLEELLDEIGIDAEAVQVVQ